jgi:hypothetical protein
LKEDRETDRPLKIKEERKSNGMQKISLVHELNAPLGREGSRLVLWLNSIDFGPFLREHTRHKSHYLSAHAKRRGHARERRLAVLGEVRMRCGKRRGCR